MNIHSLEQKVYTFFNNYSDWFLRISIAIVYIWFGILKPFDSSPAADLVANSIYFLPREPFFIFLGVWETILGVMFLIPRLTKITFWIFILHMGGTFTPFITLTDTVFTKFPYGFSLEGQYIVKNIVLISAAIAILVNYLRKTKELD
jgi:uncharacterized membrane protein YkgB